MSEWTAKMFVVLLNNFACLLLEIWLSRKSIFHPLEINQDRVLVRLKEYSFSVFFSPHAGMSVMMMNFRTE